MLKSKKSKIIFGIMIVLCVLVASSIWVSLSLKTNAVDDFDYSMLAENAENTASMTQIDHIIENSNSANTSTDPAYDSSMYYVYVIVPNGLGISQTVTDFFTGTGFTDSIINDNRTIAELMAAGKVQLIVKSVGELNALSSDDVATELGKADLIYMYADSSTAYQDGSAISENLYEALHNYAFGLNKPLIMNYGLKDDGGTPDIMPTPTTDTSVVYDMLNVDFKNRWKMSKTTNVSDWTMDTADTETILKEYMTNIRSKFTTYQVNNLTKPSNYATWDQYWMRSGDPEKTLNVLYIYGPTMSDTTAIDNVAAWMTADGRNSVFGTRSSIDNLPQKSHVDGKSARELSVADLYVTDAEGNFVPLTDATGTVQTDADGNPLKIHKYDFIFIAPDAYSTSAGDDFMDPELRPALNALSTETVNGLTYILYGTLPDNTSTGSSGNTGNKEQLTIDTSTNYGKLIDMSITTTGYAKRSNVLVVGLQYMETLAGNPANNPKKVSQVVALINKSTFRTYAGSASGGASGSVSTTAFRVLELQPCYPIDLELAYSQTGFNTNLDKYTNVTKTGTGDWVQYDATKPVGNYYTIPANVLNSSEIDNYMTTEADGSRVMDQEYYDWDLSKAKLSYALNMSADQIELVQMSSNEYVTSKTDVSDSYDLIYIGGNMSAFKAHDAYGFGLGETAREIYRNSLAIFSMYNHTGEIKRIVGGRITNNNPYQYTVMNGNDITYDRLVQLMAYIDAGMPIVFSNEIWKAYTDASANGYKNRYMDPDCNMYKLCAYAETKSNEAGNILKNWEIRQKYSEMTNANQAIQFEDYYVSVAEKAIGNPDGFYGSSDTVLVFDDDGLNNQLYECVYNSSTRPKYVIDTTAVAYVEGDTSTELTERTVNWKIKLLNVVEGHTYEAYLLEDQNDNAVFEANANPTERLSKTTFSGDTAELSYTYPSDDFGAFFWKILVQDTTTGASTGYSAITCFAKLEDQPKKQARILEIMPMTQANCESGNPSSPDGHTFYLDKNYQQSSGNPYLYSSYGTAKQNSYGYCPILHSPGNGSAEVSFNSNLIARATEDGNYQGLSDMNMGKYMSTLSVNRYDSGAGHEDRDYNYMDLVSDEYDFSLDIMYMDDIEFYANAARTSTEDEREAYLTQAENAKKIYDNYLTEGTAEYEELKEVEDALRQALMDIRDGKGYSASYQGLDWEGKPATKWDGTPDIQNLSYNDYNTYGIDQMLQSRDYFRFFYLNTAVYHGSNSCENAYLFYLGVYKPYIDVHDKMVDAYRKYRHYSMMAYGPDEYLRMNYDVIVVGFLDDYVNDFTDFSQDATDDLLAFTNYVDEEGEEDGGSLLMTHDNLTYSNVQGHALNLTATMKDVMGANPYGHLTAVAGTDGNGIPKYSSTDSKRYFLTNISSDSSMDFSVNSALNGTDWNNKIGSWLDSQGVSSHTNKLGLPGYTDIFNVYETNNGYSLRYTYAEFQIENAIRYNMQITGPLNVTGSSKATQVNRGVVTTYPFYIASDLRVSNTHSQSYTLDLENKDVSVWYTLAADNVSTAGSSGGTDYSLMKENSSYYAATPKDGANNYYIYSIGNVVYCGAGHALITGDERDNNDERRLFLNVLINMASRSKPKPEEPEIAIYDPDGTEAPNGSIVKQDTDGFYLNVTSTSSYPEFGFGMKNIAETQTVTDIKVYYDLDFDAANPDNEYYDNEDHVLLPLPANILEILNSISSDGTRGVYQLNRTDIPTLVTQPYYFAKYGGKYTYIVIRAELDDGTVLYQRIKINISRNLLDLT